MAIDTPSDTVLDDTPARALQYLSVPAPQGEWSEVARADIRRRDHLILLGLAKRKVRSKGEAPDSKASADGK